MTRPPFFLTAALAVVGAGPSESLDAGVPAGALAGHQGPDFDPLRNRPGIQGQLAQLAYQTPSNQARSNSSGSVQDSGKHIDRESALKQLSREKPPGKDTIPPELFGDREFVRTAVDINAHYMSRVHDELKNDVDFLKSLIVVHTSETFIRYNHDVLEYVPARHFDNREFLEYLSRENVSVYEYASERLRGDRDFLDLASRKQSIDLDSVPEALRHDRNILISLVRRKCFVGKAPLEDLLPRDLLHDEDLWLKAGEGSSQVLSKLPLPMLEKRSFLFRLLEQSPVLYGHLPDHLRSDKEIAQFAYRCNTINLQYLPQSLSTDRDFVKSLLRYDGLGYGFLPEEAKRKPAFILAAVETRWQIIEFVPEDVLRNNPGLVREIAKTNNLTRRILTKTLGSLPPDVDDIYVNTGKAMRLLGFSDASIYGDGRFDATQEMIRNRYEVAPQYIRAHIDSLVGEEFCGRLPGANDKRPTVVIVVARADHNNAFSQKMWINSSELIDRISRENRVLLYEIEDLQDLREMRRELINHPPASGLIIAAHGSKNEMTFGEKDQSGVEPTGDGRRDLTTADVESLKLFEGLVVDGGNVMLVSCSTGSTEGDGDNMADAMHAVMPHANIYAPKKTVNRCHVVDRLTGKITQPQYSGNGVAVERYFLPAQPRRSSR